MAQSTTSLSSITTPTGGFSGSGTLPVTISIFDPISQPLTVSLSSSNPEITLPASVTIPAGSSSANVNATVNYTSTTAVDTVRIRAQTADGFAVASDVTLAPSTLVSQLPAPTVSAAYGANVIQFGKLPTGVPSPYLPVTINRYDSTGALNATFTTTGNIYVDRVAAGSQYSYSLLVEPYNGSPVYQSPQSSLATSPATGSYLSFGSFTGGSITGDVDIPVAGGEELVLNSNQVISTASTFSSLNAVGSTGTATTGTFVSCDPQYLDPGLGTGAIHIPTLTLVSVGSGTPQVSQPLNVGLDAPLPIPQSDMLCSASDGRWPTVTMRLGLQKYNSSLQVAFSGDITTGQGGTTIRTLTANTYSNQFVPTGYRPLVTVAWDMKNSSGTTVNPGTYEAGEKSFPISPGQPPNPPAVGPPLDITYYYAAPRILALIDRYETDPGSQTTESTEYIYPISLDMSQWAANDGCSYVVLLREATQPIPEQTANIIDKWLSSDVYDLYVDGHGVESNTQYYGQSFAANYLINPLLQSAGVTWQPYHNFFPYNQINHPYDFVFFNGCNSAGFHSSTNQNPTNVLFNDWDQTNHFLNDNNAQSWTLDFQLNTQPGGGSFIGWNSETPLNITSAGLTKTCSFVLAFFKEALYGYPLFSPDLQETAFQKALNDTYYLPADSASWWIDSTFIGTYPFDPIGESWFDNWALHLFDTNYTFSYQLP